MKTKTIVRNTQIAKNIHRSIWNKLTYAKLAPARSMFIVAHQLWIDNCVIPIAVHTIWRSQILNGISKIRSEIWPKIKQISLTHFRSWYFGSPMKQSEFIVSTKILLNFWTWFAEQSDLFNCLTLIKCFDSLLKHLPVIALIFICLFVERKHSVRFFLPYTILFPFSKI